MKDIIAEYYNWHDELPQDQKDRFDFIVNLALDLCQDPMASLFSKYSLRNQFHLNYFKDYNSFWKDELYNATKSLTDLRIVKMDFSSIATDLKNQITRMKDAVAKDKEEIFLEDDARFQSQFYCVLWYCDLMDEYLTTDIDTNSDPKLFDIGKLKQFDVIIELMAQIDSIVYLFYYKETVSHKPILGRAKETTFKGLFRDKENVQKIKDILERNEYTINGKWIGLTDDKSELSCAYYALKPLLIPGYKTSQVKTFYREFGLPEDHISAEMMRRESFNANRDEFDRIFSHLIPR